MVFYLDFALQVTANILYYSIHFIYTYTILSVITKINTGFYAADLLYSSMARIVAFFPEKNNFDDINFSTKTMSVQKIKREVPAGQINEKTIMFSRNLLVPGTERFEAYYREFPGHREADDLFRTKPGLLNDKAAFFEPVTFNAAKAIFDSVHAFHELVDGEPAAEKTDLPPEEIAGNLRKWIKKEGAHSVGITKTREYHWYSLIGRGKDYGKKAQLPHSHAIAFTVEMDREMMDSAPHGPTVVESARQYMHAAVIATQAADYIRKLGFSARAHIDGNYRVVCPLVARDAGLGEIGRMGILMTPRLGPRVRIGVITTDLPLPPDKIKERPDMIEFCRICKKCADVCPANAIPHNDRSEINGVKRWQINQEACFTMWCIVGTDCGRCMSDCPYSHKDNFIHNVVRFLIRRSAIFRHIAVKLDDVIYGRRPKPKPFPKWIGNLKSEI